MLELAQMLAGLHVVHDFKFHNVGLDKLLKLKYFLGFDFTIDKSYNQDDLFIRYKQAVNGMFAQGGRFRRTSSPNNRLSKPEYHETMDTTLGKLTATIDPKHKANTGTGHLMMKKSSTAV